MTNPITTQPYNGRVGEECPICFDEFQANDRLTLLACNHVLHNHCAAPLTSCPFDRRAIIAGEMREFVVPAAVNQVAQPILAPAPAQPTPPVKQEIDEDDNSKNPIVQSPANPVKEPTTPVVNPVRPTAPVVPIIPPVVNPVRPAAPVAPVVTAPVARAPVVIAPVALPQPGVRLPGYMLAQMIRLGIKV